MRDKTIVIVGCGPGSPDYLTPAAKRAVEGAHVLVGAARLLELFPSSMAERIVVGSDVEKVLGEISSRRSQGRVAVLVSGDPGLYSLALPVISRFGRDACEVVPGISSVQVVFARLGLGWHDANVVSVHGRPAEGDMERLRDADKIAVLVGGGGSVRRIVELLEQLGEGRRVFLCEDLTLPGERIRQVDPGELSRLPNVGRGIVLLLNDGVFV
ncbi:MAG: precorrin-6y C5,15-methyltransferase (decarboxylating) subunit CbiE [Deltaproteobacteria bacterium]|nr:precorrin-6y C5,15-methyltransferase (decarboxylating) subunit CbiE [Deltaproteobacteria bacterium]